MFFGGFSGFETATDFCLREFLSRSARAPAIVINVRIVFENRKIQGANRMKVERCKARTSTTPLGAFAPVDNLKNVEYSPVGQGTFCLRTNVSMVSLKWGDVLSTLLPGSLALFALGAWYPLLNGGVENLRNVGVAGGFALLIAAALLGMVLEAFTRVTWEKFWLVRRCPAPDMLRKLDDSKLELYERGVQSSYKYATFYANFAWAVILLLISRWHSGVKVFSFLTLGLFALVTLLLITSHVQWTIYVKYQNKVFGGNENAAK
jgi:hypothetical protein